MRGADPKQTAALSVRGPEARLQLRMTQGGRTAGREVGMRWSLQNVKHGVGGGFV